MTDDRKAKEQKQMEHLIHEMPPVEIVGGKHTPPEGVKVYDRKGLVDNSETSERGVEIHDPRNG